MTETQKTLTQSKGSTVATATKAPSLDDRETLSRDDLGPAATAPASKDSRDLDDFFAPNQKAEGNDIATQSKPNNTNNTNEKTKFELFIEGSLSVNDMIPCDLRVDANTRCPLSGGSYKEFKIGQIVKAGSMPISRVAFFSRFGVPFTVIHPETKMDVCKLSTLTKVTAR